jgi:hypothetical protein
MSRTNKPLGRKDEIVIQEVDGEVLIYDLRNDKAFCLNETSAAIWKLCDGNTSVADIAGRVAKDVKATNNEDIVWLALDQLKKEKLIDGGLEAGYDHFEGMSRRQVVKKIGLSSLVAIPVVASMVAPVAAQSTSVCNGTCRCMNPVGAAGECAGEPGAGFINCNNIMGIPAPTAPMCDCGNLGGTGSGGGPNGAPGFRLGMCRF